MRTPDRELRRAKPVVATDLNSDTLTYTITSQTGGPYSR